MTTSSLFRHIEMLQAGRPWGAVLDAGTGRDSARWVSSLDTSRWTGVTGALGMVERVKNAVGVRLRPQDCIVIGNWADPALLAGEVFDTVLADYLLGAVEGFAPYAQYSLFERLRPLVRRRLYVVGLEPYVPYVPTTPAGQIICEIGRLRDACLLLAGERTYREYPSAWAEAHLERAGYRIVEVKSFPIRYGERFVDSQLEMCSARIARLGDRRLADALQSHVEDLRQRALTLNAAEGGLRHGADYVIAAAVN